MFTWTWFYFSSFSGVLWPVLGGAPCASPPRSWPSSPRSSPAVSPARFLPICLQEARRLTPRSGWALSSASGLSWRSSCSSPAGACEKAWLDRLGGMVLAGAGALALVAVLLVLAAVGGHRVTSPLASRLTAFAQGFLAVQSLSYSNSSPSKTPTPPTSKGQQPS